MSKRLERFAPEILGATRILIGTLLACHGAQKVLGAFGGALMAIGLFSRGAAFLMSGLMAAAYFMAHASRGFWPILNGGELAIVYSWMSLYLVARGPGAWALDNLNAERGEATGLSTVALRKHAAL